MLQWLISKLSLGAITKLLGTALDAWAKKQDIDLKKFQGATTGAVDVSKAVLEATTKYNETKADYAKSVLGWWPFRVILFCLLAFPAAHFCLIAFDSSLVYFFTGKYGVLGMPAVPKEYIEIEKQLLTFFILAKPVDTAVSGALGIMTKIMAKRG